MGDIEAIGANHQAFSRAGVLTHEIAERLWLVMHGYHHRPLQDEAEAVAWEILWFRPAHAYALRREEDVTGWRRTGETTTDETPERVRQHPEIAQFFRVMIPGCDHPFPTRVEFHFEPIRGGQSYRGRRRMIATVRCNGTPGVEEFVQDVPVGSRSARPLGVH